MAVRIPIISDFDGRGIDRAKKEFAQLEGAGAKAGFLLKKAFLPAIAVLGGLAAATSKAISAGEDMATANAAIAQVNKSMGLFGNETDDVTKRLIKLAEAQAREIGVSNLSIKATQTKLLTFKNLAKSADTVGGMFDRATEAALDLAAAGFGSAETNAVQLGKALQDPIKGITALARSGVTFTQQEKDKIRILVESNKILEAQELILGAIETQVGGTAAATANDTEKMKESFAQVSQSIGMSLLPILEAVTPWLQKFADWAKENPGTFQAIAAVIGAIAVAIVAVNVAMALNPFTLIAGGIAALAAGAVIAYKKFETFRNIVDGVINVFKAVAGWVQENWQLVISLVLGPIGILIANFRAFRDVAVRAFEIVAEAAERILGPIAKVIDTVGGVVGAVGKGIGKGIGAVGNVFGFAEGGVVTRPTLAMVGEGGEPEYIIPSSKMGPMLAEFGGGGGTTVNITVNGGDPEAVVDALRRYMFRNGTVPIKVS